MNELEDDCIGDIFVCRDYYSKHIKLERAGFDPVYQRLDALASASTDFDLTGQIVWPACELTAGYLAFSGRTLITDQAVLELGSGAGLCGLVASQFASDCTLSDNEPEVLALLERNIKHASTACNTRIVRLSWGNENDVQRLREGAGRERWPVIVGVEIMFQRSAVLLLFRTICELLAEDGVFILGYIDRWSGLKKDLEEEALRVGLSWVVVQQSEYVPKEDNCKQPDLSMARATFTNSILYQFRWSG